MADELKKRAEILAMAKARGKELKPEHEAELARYQQMGIIAGPEGKVRPLTDGASKQYEESIGTYAALKNAAGSFKSDYAGNAVTGGLENSLQALNSGLGTEGQRNWWANFRTTDNLIRNSLFGSALTPGEKQAYEATTISERMDPEIVKKNLQQRAEIIRKALARKTDFFKKNGFDPDAVDALAGEYSPDFRDGYQPPETVGSGEALTPEIGFDAKAPSNWRANQADQDAFASFVQGNREHLTPELLQSWLSARGLPTLDNAEDYVKGVRASASAPTEFNYSKADQAAKEAAQRRVREDLPLSNPVVAAAAGFGDVIPGRDKIIAGVKTIANDRPYSQNLADTRNDADVIAEDNPLSTLAGNVGGLVLGGKALAGAFPRAASMLESGSGATQIAKGAGADAVYGGVRGSVNSDNDPVIGGLTQSLQAGAGSAAGRIGAAGVGRVLNPATNAAVDLLRSKGVRVTPGQALGPTASAAEEKLQSIPFVGDLIRKGRDRAEGDFNAAVLNEALEQIGTKLPDGMSGTQAMAYAQRAFDDAYSRAREGMTLVADRETLESLSAIKRLGETGEISQETADRVAKIYNTHVGRRLAKGQITGKEYKEMHSAIGKQISTARRNGNQELSSALGDLQATLDEAAARASPPQFVDAMRQADNGYARFVRAENAAKMRGGDAGTFSATQYDRAVQAGDDSVRSRAYSRGDALGQDLATAGKNILRDRVPDSGTAGRVAMRALVGGGTGLASYFDPTGATPWVAGGLASLYLPGVRNVATKAIAGKRSGDFKKLGDLIVNQDRLASSFGVAPFLAGD